MPMGASTPCNLRPELPPDRFCRLLQRPGVGTGGEVLPAAVGDHERDVRTLPVARSAAGLCESGVEDRARRDAGEDAFLLDQLAGPPQGVVRPDGETAVEDA